MSKIRGNLFLFKCTVGLYANNAGYKHQRTYNNINCNVFMEEQDSPGQGEEYHKALNDGNHIERNKRNCLGIKVEADTGIKAKQQHCQNTHQ